MGLAAVLGLVRGHGGAVSLNSAPGEGTTIRVYLPTYPAADLDQIRWGVSNWIN